jgi:hypothetical protein
MAGRSRFLSLFAVTLTIASVFHAGAVKAFDEVNVQPLGGGTPILDLTYGEGGSIPTLEALGLSAAGPSFGTPPGGFGTAGFAIILTEPAGLLEAPDAAPPVYLPNGVQISDVILVDPVSQGLYFVSDGSQDWTTVTATANALFLAGAAVPLLETGALQDLTPYLPGSPYKISFLSDVPEPGTMALVTFGLLGMAVRARRVRS